MSSTSARKPMASSLESRVMRVAIPVAAANAYNILPNHAANAALLRSLGATEVLSVDADDGSSTVLLPLAALRRVITDTAQAARQGSEAAKQFPAWLISALAHGSVLHRANRFPNVQAAEALLHEPGLTTFDHQEVAYTLAGFLGLAALSRLGILDITPTEECESENAVAALRVSGLYDRPDEEIDDNLSHLHDLLQELSR